MQLLAWLEFDGRGIDALSLVPCQKHTQGIKLGAQERIEKAERF